MVFVQSIHTFLQILAKKMTVLYKLAKGQLSRQYHYDFGLRALKAVLVMAGELKRGSPDLNEVINIIIMLFYFYDFLDVSSPEGHGVDESSS